MATRNRRDYPRLDQIRDDNIRESLRLLWDKTHDQTSTVSTASADLAAAQATIAQLQSTISSMQKMITQMAAGGGIAQPSRVQGGSSSGTSGGGGGSDVEAPSDIPNHQAAVQQAIDDLTAALIPLAGYCGSFQVTKLVAWRLMTEEPNIGLGSAKPGSANNCDGYNSELILYKINGNDQLVYAFDILTDSDGATHNALWNYLGPLPIGRWRPPIAPAI